MVKTIEAIRAPFAKLTLEERAALYLLLKDGREEGLSVWGGACPSRGQLREIGEKTKAEEIARLLNKVFVESIWSLDKKVVDNYGEQLEKTVALLVKEFECESPVFLEDKETMRGIVEREKWLLENSVGLPSWSEVSVEKLTAQLREKLLAKGTEEKDSARVLAAAFVTGGFTIFRPMVGFQLELIAAVLLNIIAKAIRGNFLPPFFNIPITVSIISSRLGGITTAILFALAMATPRRKWEIYIPAVLLIALARQRNSLCPLDLDKSRLCLSQWWGGPRVERRPEGGVTIRFPEGAGLVLVVRGARPNHSQKEVLVYRECGGGKKVRLKNH